MYFLIPLIFIGIFIYLIFSRKGGMGCCGGHGGHSNHGDHDDHEDHEDHYSDKEKKEISEPVSQIQDGKVIDLLEGRDYVLLPLKDDERRFR